VIFADYKAAIEWASGYAHAFDAFEILSDGTYRIVLESPETAPIVPGTVLPLTVDLPPGVTVVERHEPQLPDHVQKVETALTRIRIPHRDPELAAQGETEQKWHSLSPFWIKTIARAYFFKKPQNVWRVGRRGGKSSSISRVAVAELAFREWRLPGGTTGLFAIMSAIKDNADMIRKTMQEILAELGIDHKMKYDDIVLPGQNVMARVCTASEKAVRAPTCIGAICDELAFWGAEDAKQSGHVVLKALRPTMITTDGILWMISSPNSAYDAHYEAFERGSTPHQTAFYAPTWIAHPALTEERTHAAEPDAVCWEQEYKAIPMASGESKFFPATAIDDACIPRVIDILDDTLAVAAGADLGFRRNSCAIVIARAARRTSDGATHFEAKFDREWVPGSAYLRPGEVLSEMAEIAQEHGVDTVCSDLHYVETLREHLDRVEIPLTDFPNQQSAIVRAYVRTRVLLTSGCIDLSGASPLLIEQLKQTTQKVDSSGVHISNPEVGGRHGDIASALIAALYALDTEQAGESVGGDRRFHDDHGSPDGWIEHSWEYEDD
jgi:hypothetical protein